MALSAADIAHHPRLAVAIRQQAETLLSVHAVNPRVASVFATQQRWLLAHIALALYFRSLVADAPAPFHATGFVEQAAARGVASRNTADAFIKEMQKYGYVRPGAPGADRRIRALEPAPITLDMIAAWVAIHLTTLDGLDGGRRCAAFQARPESIGAIQPLIAEGLLQSEAIRAPTPTFSLFTWLNEGGIVMDWLYAGLAEMAPGSARIPSTVTSFAELEERINLSRSHLTRKLRRAEAMGSLGWLGERGKSIMWVSAGFLGEYHTQQSVKLAIVDGAFEAAGVPEVTQSQAG